MIAMLLLYSPFLRPSCTAPSTPPYTPLQRKMEQRLAQRERRKGEHTKEEMERKQTEADLRRNGLLSARGGKAGDHFLRAA